MNTALKPFSPAGASWFSQFVGTPTAVQAEGWPVIAAGEHVLISAPTGTGKTLCAFLVFIDRYKALARKGALDEGLRLIYISPLKALGNDIRENLRRPLDGIDGPEITASIRTGDTTQAERRRMLKHPPTILITTPESLYLLLTSLSGRELLKTAETIVLDELHAMINTKRGAHLMLSLARLDKLCGRSLQRIGLSATIEPLADAAAFLTAREAARIVAPVMHKDVDIAVNGPLEDMRTLPEGTIWPEIARSVHSHCEGARTVIAFVEGRAQAEKLAHYVNAIAGEGFARTHHGCVSKEQRLQAEQQLRRGELRLLCATSSMELGIDVGEVDLVLQLGFPRTISSTMQRLGRAGHNPGRTSVMHMFPRTAAEGVTCGLTACVALSGGIERSNPPRKCLDVLAQHLVSMAACEPYTVEEALALAHSAYNFAEVTAEEIRGLLAMLAGDFEHAMDHPARPRLLYDRIHDRIEGDNYSRMLALSSGGTIPDRGLYTVRLIDGTRLGELDEEYVFEARVADKFLLGAFAWRIEEIRHDTVIVSPASPEGAQPPFWKGDQFGRSYQTGQAFGKLMRNLTQASARGRLSEALLAMRLDDWAARNAAHFLNRQLEASGCLPDDQTVLVEHFQDGAGDHQLMIHSLFGGRVNAALSVLLQETARSRTGMDVICFDDDDGILLFPYGGKHPLPNGLLLGLTPDKARSILEAALPATPLFNMAFRYNAGRALMLGVRGGKRQPLWVQRLRGAQALDEAVGQAMHPLVEETRRECLEDYWDLPALEDVLKRIQSGEIAVREIHLTGPSPMALPLRRMAEATLMYDYFPTPRSVQQAALQATQDALSGEAMLAPTPEQLALVGERRRLPQDPQQLHSLLMAEGDLVSGEIDVPITWLEALAREERALYIEPGLWIAAEHAAQYEEAMAQGVPAAQARVLRRCLRYRGAQSADSVSTRYFWPETHAQALLDSLVADGIATRDGDIYYHADLYSRARRETVAERRRLVKTLPPERYASLIGQRTRVNAGTSEQLRQGLVSLLDQPFSPALWESVLLPARCAGYKPPMLDALLSEGDFFWRLTSGEKPLLSFHRSADIDWESAAPAYPDTLDDADRKLVDALARRGASFAQTLTPALEGRAPLAALMGLARRGLAHADSFAPIRQWLDQAKKTHSQSTRARVSARAGIALAGRWELTRPLLEKPPEEAISQQFERVVLLCRETAPPLVWSAALASLRVWEYTGKARRGYFIEGLSGAQFLSGEAYGQAMLAMEHPREDVLWLNAADPAQLWGKALAHKEGRAFMNIPGTAVALRGGVPVAVLERQGHTLRVLESAHLHEALAAFVRDYEQRRVFAGHARIVVKEYPMEAKDALESCGFTRQMLDYELWQKRL